MPRLDGDFLFCWTAMISFLKEGALRGGLPWHARWLVKMLYAIEPEPMIIAQVVDLTAMPV